jgi:hypothetical protein
MSPKNKRRKRKDGGGETYKPPQSEGLRNDFAHRRKRPFYNGRRTRPEVDDTGVAAAGLEAARMGDGLQRAKSMSQNPRVRRIVRAKGLEALDLGRVRRARAVTVGALPVRAPQDNKMLGWARGGPGEKPESGAPPQGKEGQAAETGTVWAIEDSNAEFDDVEPEDGRASTSESGDTDGNDNTCGHTPYPVFDQTVARFLRSSSPSRYSPGPIRTQPAFGLYAVPAMTAVDVLSGDAGRASAATVPATAAVTDEAVLDELAGHFAGYGFRGGERGPDSEATLDRYWAAAPRPPSASSRGGRVCADVCLRRRSLFTFHPSPEARSACRAPPR